MKVKKFGVEGYFAFYRDAQGMSPQVALREFVQNSYEAKASKVEIRVTQGTISILDDGVGMNAKSLERNFGNFQVSEKGLGDDRNFGIGAKMAFMSLGGPETTVTSRKGGRGKPYQIRLGKVSGASETGGFDFGIVLGAGEEAVVEGTLPAGWSTIVKIKHPFDDEDVVKAINGRFLSPPPTVVKSEGTSVLVRGFVSCMEASCTRVFRHELSTCTLYWGARSTTAETKRIRSEEWDGPALAFAFKGEVFQTKDGRFAQKWLDGCGVLGAAQLHVLIEPKGKELRWNNNRTSVLGVTFEAIQEEIAQAIESGALQELAAFIEVFEAQHCASQATYDRNVELGLANMLGLLGAKLPGKGPNPNPPKGGSGGNPGGGGGSGGGSGTRRRRGLPLPMQADSLVTSGDPVFYSEVRHVLYVWYEHPLWRDEIQGARTKKDREVLKALLGIELAYKWAAVFNLFGEVSADDLQRIASDVTLFRVAATKGINARIADLFKG